MPGERITLKTREKIRGLEKGNWVKEEEKDEETEGVTSRSLGRFAPPREKYQGKITLSSSSTTSSSTPSFPLCFAGRSRDRGCAAGRPVWAREGECASAHRFAMRSEAMPPSSPPLPSTTTFGTDNGANTPRG